VSINIPTFYSQQYATNIELLLQQMGSRFRGAVMSKSYVGKAAQVVDQIGQVAAQKVIGRFSPMGRIDAPTDARWVYPVDYDLPQLVDSFDLLKMIVDPKSSLVQNAVYAMGRAQDDEIIAAFHGTAKTGSDGSTSTTLPSTQVVGVAQGAASAVGLTVAKLREAKRILMANEVDFERDPIYIGVKATQHDNLLAETQVINLDYNEKPVLVEGKITRFLGMEFIHSERLLSGTDDAAGTSVAVPVWAKSGMHLGLWEDIKTSTSIRNDIQGEPFQAYCKESIGATRTQEKKVVKIWCR